MRTCSRKGVGLKPSVIFDFIWWFYLVFLCFYSSPRWWAVGFLVTRRLPWPSALGPFPHRNEKSKKMELLYFFVKKIKKRSFFSKGRTETNKDSCEIQKLRGVVDVLGFFFYDGHNGARSKSEQSDTSGMAWSRKKGTRVTTTTTTTKPCSKNGK